MRKFRKLAAFVLSLWILMLLYFVETNEPARQSLPRDVQSLGKLSGNIAAGTVLNKSIVIQPKAVDDNHEDVIHVCFTSDKNTIPGAIAAINSIRQNTNHKIKYHLIVEKDIIKDVRAWLKGSVLKNVDYRVLGFDVSVLQGKIKIRGGRSELGKPMNYARFLYPEILGPKVKGRIVHIDDDVIVRGDIATLARTRFKDSQIAAFSEDCKSHSKRSISEHRYINFLNFDNDHIKKLHFDRDACSFNTGVFVTDIDAWRAQDISKQLLYWMELNTREGIYGNKRGGGGSQPPMMIVFYKKYTPINPIWHVRNLGSSSEVKASKELIEKAQLLHWSGPKKPWTATSHLQELWDQYFVPDPQSKYKPAHNVKGRHS